MIVHESEICSQLYFIESGMIRTFLDRDGEQITTWVALQGTIETSAKSFIREIPSEISLEALTECHLLVIDRQHYYALLRDNKAFNSFAIKLMENFYLRIEDKFYSSLSLSAEERFIKFMREYPEHAKKVPLKYLASILRMTPETLSRLRKKKTQKT